MTATSAMHADLALGMVRAHGGTTPVRRAQLEAHPPADLLDEAAEAAPRDTPIPG